MSTVTMMGRIETEYQAAYLEGDTGLRFETEDLNKRAWRCDGCGLVWTRKHQAENCQERGHVSSFNQEYYSNQRFTEVNGRRVYIPEIFVRKAIRRDDADDISYAAWLVELDCQEDAAYDYFLDRNERVLNSPLDDWEGPMTPDYSESDERAAVETEREEAGYAF